MEKSDLERDREGWEIVASETHFSSPHLSVATERVRTPANPEPHPWSVVHRKPAVVIAPLTREGRFVLIREERIPVRAEIWSCMEALKRQSQAILIVDRTLDVLQKLADRHIFIERGRVAWSGDTAALIANLATAEGYLGV